MCKPFNTGFVSLQGNVPIGDVDIPRVIVSDLPRCHCKADSEAPCGPDSDCINRCMFYECHTAVCPAGERCLNQRFQRRHYPAVKPFRTDRRGWGLMACVNIDKVIIMKIIIIIVFQVLLYCCSTLRVFSMMCCVNLFSYLLALCTNGGDTHLSFWYRF